MGEDGVRASISRRALLYFVIPAKPHTSSSRRKRDPSAFSFDLRRFSETDSRPCELRPPSWRTSHFLLLVQEKVTKENTPSRPRSPGIVPGDFARALRRFADGTSLCRQRTRAHRARAPAGFFLRALAAAEREPGGASAAVLAAEAKQKRKTDPKIPQSSSRRKPGPSAFALALLLALARVGRRRADGSGPRAARVSARDRAAFRCRHRMACRQNPGRP